MPQILNPKAPFVDGITGDLLVAGILRCYLIGTATPQLFYSDKACTLEIGYSLVLTGGAMLPFEGVFCKEDAIVHVLDSNDLYLYSFEMTGSSQEAEVTPAGSVGTIPELKAVDPAVSQIVTVAGYSAPGDCPSRVAVWDETSVAPQDGGSVFQSDVSPTGRWLITYAGPYIDARCFGLLPGPELATSDLLAASQFCLAAGLSLYIPSTSITLAGGTDITISCPVRTEQGGYIQASSACTITLTNPGCELTTFAGPNIKLKIDGLGWDDTTVPLSAFGIVSRGYSEGTARFKFHLTSDANVLIFAANCSYSEVSVDVGLMVSCDVGNGVQIWCDHLAGPGQIMFNQNVRTFFFREVRTSLIASRAMEAVYNTTQKAYIETDITLVAGTIAADLIYAGGNLITGNSGVITNVSGYIQGPAAWIRGSGALNLGSQRLDAAQFLPDTAMRSWNASSMPVLDMQYASTGVSPAKVGKIVNAILTNGIESPSIHLVSCSVTGATNSATVTGEFCTFSNVSGRPFPSLTSSTLSMCTLTGSTAIQGLQTVSDARWENVTYNSFLKIVGGGVIFNEVNCKNLTLIPGSTGYLSNVAIRGGTMELIDFNAAQQANVVLAKAQVVHISGVRGLQSGIRATNGATKYWAMSGHYSVIVTDNENARATKGSRRFVFESPTYSNFVYSGQVSTEGQILFLHPVLLWPASENFFSQYSISAQAMRTSDGYTGSYSTSVKGTIGLYAGRMVYVHAEIIAGAALAPETVCLDWNLYP